STACKQFIAQVNRNPLNAPVGAGLLNSVTTFPINISDETVSGIQAQANYRLEAGRYGDFRFRADYNTTLKHEYKQFPEDPLTDYLHSTDYYNQVKNIGSASVTWDIGPWSSTVRTTRFGKTWSYDGKSTV